MILDRYTLDNTVMQILNYRLEQVADCFKEEYEQDVQFMSYTGDISEGFLDKFIEFVELVKYQNTSCSTLGVVLKNQE